MTRQIASLTRKADSSAGERRRRDQQGEGRVGVLDRQRAEGAKGARDLEVGDDDHHAEQQRDRVPVDGVERLVEADAAEGDHRRAAEEGDAGAVEPEAGNAPDRHAAIDEDEDDRRGEAGDGHEGRA